MCLFIGNKCDFNKAMQIASSQPLASLKGYCTALDFFWDYIGNTIHLVSEQESFAKGKRLSFTVYTSIFLLFSNLIPKSALSVKPKLGCILTSLKPSSSVSVAIRSSLHSAAFWVMHSKLPFIYSFLQKLLLLFWIPLWCEHSSWSLSTKSTFWVPAFINWGK